MLKKTVLWILVISCMTLIFAFSSQEAEQSGKTSSSFIKNIVRLIDFKGALSEEKIDKISEDMTFIVRKCAHFSIYALLGALLAMLVFQYGLFGKKQLFASTGISFLYACSDELHQLFVRGRSCQATDVLLDTFGALCGALFIMLVTALIKKLCDNIKLK